MSWLDLIIVGLAVLAAVGGYRLGFLARASSWIGLGLGLYVAARFLSRIVSALDLANPVSRLMVAAAVLIGGAFVGQALGLLLGARLSGALPLGSLRSIDRGIGACLGIAGILVAVWILVPSMADVPGWPARSARTSSIARWVDTHFPQPPDTVATLRRLVGSGSFPEVFGALHAGESLGPPPPSSGLSPAVLARVTASTVKVEGQACGRIQDGSGFAAGVDEIVTNAHVVAGEPTGHTEVQLPGKRLVPATVVLFDPERDLAVLRVSRLGAPPLPTATATVGETGAVFGHPGGSDALVIAPAAIDQEITATGRDLYDTRSIRRDVFVLAAELHPGDSGGPLVNASGAVVGVAFAIAPDRPSTAYALTSKEINAALDQPRGPAVSTGRCLAD
jgi:S1-C subfamily serine protease